MKRWIRRLGKLLASLAISLLVLEGAARWFGRIALNPVESLTPMGRRFYAAQMFESLPREELHFRGRPHASVEVAGIRYEHNELGLRERKGIPPKRPDETRIILLGDSNVYGWGVAQEDLLSLQLERTLNEGRAADRPVTVIGAGFPGYNNRDELELYRELAPLLEPDVVLLAWYPNDPERFGMHVDSEGVVFGDPLPVPARWKPALWHSRLYRAISLTYTINLTHFHSMGLDAKENLDFVATQLHSLAVLTRSQGRSFALLDVPLLAGPEGYDRIDPATHPGEATRAWLAGVAQREGIPRLSLLDSLAGEPLADLWVHPGSGDRHPNARALAAFARATAEFLRERGLVK